MPNTVELLRNGQPVKVERIRILLVSSRGTLVTRETIIEHLWSRDVYSETERIDDNPKISPKRIVGI